MKDCKKLFEERAQVKETVAEAVYQVMLVEKLFLNILIVLAPTLVFTAFGERWRHAQSPYVIGVLNGVASSLCLIFSFYFLDLYWDLRYVPLVISTIYGGPVAGVINLIMILASRTYLGGNALFFGYISIMLTFLTLLLAAYKVKGLSGISRIKATALISLLPSIVMLIILISFTFLNHVQKTSDFQTIFPVSIFAVFQTLGAWLASMLQEFAYERVKMKAEIQRAEKMKTLGELAASIAHEVRNPLTVVRGFLQLMRPNETDKNKFYLQTALEELGRAESIINDYLNFSKPKLTKFESFPVSDVINNIVLLLTPMANKNSTQLHYSHEGHIYLYTDRGQLQQALLNVIKNAMEATSAGGEVSIISKIIDKQAEIKIIDSGKGMTQDQLSRIGTLFFSTKEVGTGLGTAVSLRIIEAMNGKIVYASEKDIGTTVTITLPMHAS